MALDLLLFELIHSFLERFSFLKFIALFFSVYFPWAVAFLLFIVYLREKDRRKRVRYFLFTALLLVLSAGVAGTAIRFFSSRPRPYETLGFEPVFTALGTSFPSLTAVVMFAMAFAVLYARPHRANIFFISAVLVSLSRIASGVEWPMDVLAGFFLAFAGYYSLKAFGKDFLAHKTEV
jgi:undecaprenyl-diphosphatase